MPVGAEQTSLAMRPSGYTSVKLCVVDALASCSTYGWPNAESFTRQAEPGQVAFPFCLFEDRVARWEVEVVVAFGFFAGCSRSALSEDSDSGTLRLPRADLGMGATTSRPASCSSKISVES